MQLPEEDTVKIQPKANSQVYLSLEETPGTLFKVVILEIFGNELTGKSDFKKRESKISYHKEKALELLLRQAKRSYFGE